MTAVKWGSQDLAAVYYGTDKIWPVTAAPAPAPTEPPLTIGGIVNTMEMIFGPSYPAHLPGIIFRPAGDTGVPAEWVDENGTKRAIAEGQVAIISGTSDSALATTGGDFFPLVAHNGTLWNITGVRTGWQLTRSSGISLTSNQFRGFYTATKADHAGEMRKIAADAFEDDSFGFYVDPAANTITMFGRPASSKDMSGMPASMTLTMHLPPGMTSNDLLFPLGTRS
jgi:hypothetical protein